MDDLPTVLDAFNALCPSFAIGMSRMAWEFKRENVVATQTAPRLRPLSVPRKVARE
jgi:hypothetical protein